MTKPSTHPGRVIVALIISTMIGCAAGLICLPMLGESMVRPPDTAAFIELLIFVWIATLPVSIIFGALAHWALLRLKFWPVTAYTIAGMFLGPVAIIVWDISTSTSFQLRWLPPELTWLGVIVGGTTALAFRIMVHKSTDSASFP